MKALLAVYPALTVAVVKGPIQREQRTFCEVVEALFRTETLQIISFSASRAHV